ncbi:hypothetical protein KBB96_01270 [Luteolibacter ambystomatis]|uniref:Uncharacterized protein n=1 Tax=Luteolibacter ambystomatis TaxID=2824561 RepID=A0A975G8Y9_9BACT|nr:hypothetical protein [Luteolibacter ambystomatis]QUE51537.1 hypothetical protein KBB96_01270 [Luteolibacter ambystomatis]
MNDPIEVEVLEVDGMAPRPHVDEAAPEPQQTHSWQQGWQGRVKQLDMRWWPLWVVLGVIALGLLLTVGVVVGVLLLVVKIVGGLVGSVLRLFAGPVTDTRLRR